MTKETITKIASLVSQDLMQEIVKLKIELKEEQMNREKACLAANYNYKQWQEALSRLASIENALKEKDD